MYKALVLIAGLALAISLTAYRSGAAQAGSHPLQFWTVAKSETWHGTPDPRVRYMVTVGASELSTGLQLSGFRGSADLIWVPVEQRPEVRRVVTVTALKARVLSVRREKDTVMVTVRTEPKGYQLVGVDMTEFMPGTQITFVFQDPEGVELGRNVVVIEAFSESEVKEAIKQAFEDRARVAFMASDLMALTQHYDIAYSKEGSVVGGSLLAYEQRKIRDFHRYLALRHVKTVSIRVELTFESVVVSENRATAKVEEGLAWEWAYEHIPAAVNFTGLGTQHEVELVRIGDHWVIRRDDYLDPLREGYEPDHVTPRGELHPAADQKRAGRAPALFPLYTRPTSA